MLRSVFIAVTILIMPSAFGAAADDDLFSSQPTKPSPAVSVPAPSRTPTPPAGVTVASVLPEPPAGPLTAEQVDALRAQYVDVVERLKKLLEAGKTDPDRDRVLHRLAEVAIDAGEYDLAASTVEFFTTELFAINDVLKPVLVRLHAQKNPQGVRFALGRANQLADKMGWESAVIGRIVDNTQFAYALGDPVVFREQLQNVITVTDQLASRTPGDVWVGLEIALKMPAIHRLEPAIAHPFHASLRQRVSALPDSDALKYTRRAEVAQLLFRTGQFADAVTEVAFAGESAVAIYTDAASLAQADSAALAAKVTALTAAYAERDAFDRAVVFGLAAHALSAAGRHEDAVRVALHAETHRGTYGARANSTYSKAPLHKEWDALSASPLAPAEYENVLTSVVVQAVQEGATQAVLTAALQDPAAKPHARVLLNIALNTLLALERLDDAVSAYLMHDSGDNGYGPSIATALIRAGRLDDVESALLDRVSDERRATLARSWVELADAWMARGDRDKARAVLTSAGRGTKSSDWQIKTLAIGWSRLGDTAQVTAARDRGPQNPENLTWFGLLELQALADAGDFPPLAQRIAALPPFAKDSQFWFDRADVLCDTLARAGQWKLLAALSEKATGIEQARPFIAELDEVLRGLKRAANQSAAPAVAGDAKVLLAPYAQWAATTPAAERAAREDDVFYFHGRLGAWEEAFAAANASDLTAARRTQAYLRLANAARDNRDWARAAECLAKAREALAQVTGAERTAPLLITYCNEALFVRDLSDLADRFRETAQLINQSTSMEERTNQFTDLALVAVYAGDGPAFNQLGGAAIQASLAWTKEAPGENGGASRGEYSMAWLVRQLVHLGHLDPAVQISFASVKNPAERTDLDARIATARLLATPDDQLVGAVKKIGDPYTRLKTLLGSFRDGLVVQLAEKGRAEIAFQLMLMARDSEFGSSMSEAGFGADVWTNATATVSLEHDWPNAVENMARAYLSDGRVASAVKLGELYTTPPKTVDEIMASADKEEDGWEAMDDRLFGAKIDYTGAQVRLAAFFAEKGQPDEARRLLQAIPASKLAEADDFLRENVVIALAQLGEIARAENLANAIKDPGSRMNAHSALVIAAVRKNDATLTQKHLALARTAAADEKTKSNWKRPVYIAALMLGGAADAALQEVGTLEGYTQNNAAYEPALQLARLGRWNDIAPWIARLPDSTRAMAWTMVLSEIAPRPRDPSIKP